MKANPDVPLLCSACSAPLLSTWLGSSHLPALPVFVVNVVHDSDELGFLHFPVRRVQRIGSKTGRFHLRGVGGLGDGLLGRLRSRFDENIVVPVQTLAGSP